jgi:SAM-dependent methyltransferase
MNIDTSIRTFVRPFETGRGDLNTDDKLLPTVPLDTDYGTALGLMLRAGAHEVLVVNEVGKAVGHVTLEQIREIAGSPERLRDEILNHPNSSKSDPNVLRHFARYHFARNFLSPGKKVLDCACGIGYGAAILGQSGANVLGVDVSSEAIAIAVTKYSTPNVSFLRGDIENLQLDMNVFDAIVSIETFEHLDREVANSWLLHIDDLLVPGGVLILSSPMLRFKDGQPYITNPYHINEKTRDEITEMIEGAFPRYVVHYYHQQEDSFLPLLDENSGFCIVVARKRNSG